MHQGRTYTPPKQASVILRLFAGPPDGLDLSKDLRPMSAEEGRGAAMSEHPFGLGQDGPLDSRTVKPLVVPLLRLQPTSHSRVQSPPQQSLVLHELRTRSPMHGDAHDIEQSLS